MGSDSKRFKSASQKVDKTKAYPLAEAVKLLKETATVKFDSSAEIHINLGIDPTKGDQIVRASVVLPHGSGKTKKIAAFVTPAMEKEAKASGADIVGGKDLIEKIKKDGICDFEVAVAMPDLMKDLAVIAKTLGQKGLMPNPKTGTVTSNVKQAIEEIKKGKIDFKNDDTGNLHAMVGKVSFTEQALEENIKAFLDTVKKAKPDAVKGTYLNSITLKSTMGPAIRVQI